MKKMIMSDEHIRQMTKWFGKDRNRWKGKKIKIYNKIVRDGDGKKIGTTFGICLPHEEPIDPEKTK